jgi:hypothetical protein
MTVLTKSLLLALALTCPNILPAQAVARANYVGGTVGSLMLRAKGAIGTGDDLFVFATKNSVLRIPYERINLIEYGQSVSRRYILAILISPLFVLCKTRAHFITVGYSEETGQQHAIVLRIDKRAVRSTLAALEARTGLKIQYTDEETRIAGPG